MKKFIKFVGSLLASIIFIILFLITLTYKAFCIPFFLGLLGILFLVLLVIDTKSFKKEWKSITIIGITSMIFIFSAGHLFCTNYNGPNWLFNICHFGLLISLTLDAFAICVAILLSIYKKIKKS